MSSNNFSITLKGKKILLGISGSIAAFKALDIIRGLRDAGAEVRVALTENAKRFVTPLTLETLSGQRVIDSLWGEGETVGTHHIDHARWADLVLIAPATANLIGKLAHGIADDFLTTEVLAVTAGTPVWIAPAMNPQMAAHPAVRENIAKLRGWGIKFLGPVAGETSCGEIGEGRMMEPSEIVWQLASNQSIKAASSKKWIITMGPTLSRLDPVRYLTNRSSGKMGAALAWAAHARGMEVTVIAGPTQQSLPAGIETVFVQTADQMLTEVQARWAKADFFIGAAAVLDFEFSEVSAQKLKKGATLRETLAVRATPDILAWVCANKRVDQRVLGFAAETDQHLSHAYEKLLKKGCDAIFMNDVSRSDRGFESDTNAGVLVSKDSERPFELMNKTDLAQALVDLELAAANQAKGQAWKSSAASPS